MRDHLVLYINGARHVVRGRDAFLSLSDYLRTRLALISTKIVCSEGDCGACTVLIGRPQPTGESAATEPTNGQQSKIQNPKSKINYLPIDSCIQFMFQLDGAHVVTAEGLRPDGALNRVQQAMIDCHGSQCGFCTPGFVMAMTGLLEESESLDEPQLRTGLTGNLCRCTGYTPILEAGLAACDGDHDRLNDLYPPEPILADLAPLADDDVEITEGSGTLHLASPSSLNQALAFLAAHPTASIVAGATDIGVRANKARRLPPVILDLNRIENFCSVAIGSAEIAVFGRATWTDLLTAISTTPRVARRGKDNRLRPVLVDTTQNEPRTATEQSAIRRHDGDGLGEFARIISTFGARQIRNVGTIAGNIANASPIADSLPFLFVMEALVCTAGSDMRLININDFYHGYRQTDLKPGELIAGVRIPRPDPDDLLRLYKVSRRRDLDIAGFTAAIRVRLRDDLIDSASIALGAVGPTVLRCRGAEKFLLGKPLTEETMQAAGDRLVEEITPISDVRGAADYRRQLARNVLLKFYHQTQTDLAPA